MPAAPAASPRAETPMLLPAGDCQLESVPAYFKNLLVVRSFSGLPPVWQVGQYCSDESA
jgi:hypothetical protein